MKTVFGDIRSTLGVPMVGLLFRRLAVYPWYLELAWRNLKPNASTVFFHRVADDLRNSASESPSTGDAAPRPRDAIHGLPAGFGTLLAALLDAEPKVLLAAGALRAGSNGQLPKMNLISSRDRQVVVLPTVQTSTEIQQARDETVTAEELSLLDSLTRTGEWTRDSDMAGLMAWPREFSGAWSMVAERMKGPELDRRAAELQRRVDMAVEALPFRMEISATACRQAGLGEDQIDQVRAIVNQAFAVLPRSLLALGALAAVVEKQPEPVSAG